MENPMYSIRIIRKQKEFFTSRRTNSSYTCTEKDQSHFSPSTHNIEGLHARNLNSFKDPTLKKHRFDYQIFFNKKTSSRNDSRPITANERKKAFSPFPARFCHIDKKQAKKLRYDNCAESDLKLIRDINCDSNRKGLEMEKLYRNYVLNFQTPTGNDILISAGEIGYTHKLKKVRFDLTQNS